METRLIRYVDCSFRKQAPKSPARRRINMKRVLLLPIFLAGCAASVDADPDETSSIAALPLAEFDPGKKVIPFPNNLVTDAATGKLALPAQRGETSTGKVLREQGL